MSSQLRARNTVLTTIALLLAITQTAHAGRKLHVIVAADANDPTIGRYCDTDARAIKTLFATSVYMDELNIVDIPVSQLNSAGVQTAIRNAGIRPKDAVLFYYTGHGNYARDGKHYMVANNKWISRAVVVSALRERGAGLAVLMTDACFNFNDVPAPGGSTFPTKRLLNTAPLFRKLFFETNGFIDLSSCQRDEKAATHPDPSLGSVFTKAFVDTMNLKQAMSTVTWQAIVDDVSQETSRQFQLQHPDGETIETGTGNFINQRSQTVAKLVFNISPHAPVPDASKVPGLPQPTPGADSAPIKTVDLQFQIDPYSGRTHETRTTIIYDPSTGRTTTRPGRREFKGIASVVKASDNTEYWRWPQVRDPDIVVGDPTYVQKRNRVPESGAPKPRPMEPPSNGARQISSPRLGLSVSNHSGQGVLIRKVTAGGPTTKCVGTDGRIWRLEAGDAITKINSRSIANVNEFATAARTSPQLMGILVVGHDGESHQMTVTLKTATPPKPPAPVPGKGPRFGVTVSTQAGTGIIVTSVVPGSPATKCAFQGQVYRLEVGDVITRVNGKKVKTEAAFASAVLASGRVMTFRVRDLEKNKSFDFTTTLNH